MTSTITKTIDDFILDNYALNESKLSLIDTFLVQRYLPKITIVVGIPIAVTLLIWGTAVIYIWNTHDDPQLKMNRIQTVTDVLRLPLFLFIMGIVSMYVYFKK